MGTDKTSNENLRLLMNPFERIDIHSRQDSYKNPKDQFITSTSALTLVRKTSFRTGVHLRLPRELRSSELQLAVSECLI